MSDVKPEPIRWLWPSRLALGKLSFLVGDPGLGKSLVSLAIAAAVTRGARWPVDATPAPEGEVVLLSAEDDIADTIRPRLETAGADVNRIHVLQMVRDVDRDGQPFFRGFNLRCDLELLTALLADHPAARLVVVDPISAYLGETESHNNADVRGLLAPLAELAASQGVAVLGISHLNKGGGPAIYRTSGSLAFVAAARAVYVVTRDKEDGDRRLVLPVKNNLAPDATGLAYRLEQAENEAPVVAWEPEAVTITAEEALAPAVGDDARTEREEAKAWLREVLAAGPLPVIELQSEARAAGHAWPTVRRAKGELGVKSVKAGFSGKWTWKLPAEGDHPSRSRGEGVVAFDETRAPPTLAGSGNAEDDHLPGKDRLEPPNMSTPPKAINTDGSDHLGEPEARKPAPRLGFAEGDHPRKSDRLRGDWEEGVL